MSLLSPGCRSPYRHLGHALPLALAALGTAAALACKPPPAVAPIGGSELPTTDTRGGKATKPTDRPAGMPDFAKAIRVAFDWNPERSAVIANIHLEPGFHAYGPGERTGKPLGIEITGEDWKVEEVKIPGGVEKDLGELGKSFVVTGDVVAEARVAPLGDPKEPVTGMLRYQVCTETSCDRPRTMSFQVNPR